MTGSGPDIWQRAAETVRKHADLRWQLGFGLSAAGVVSLVTSLLGAAGWGVLTAALVAFIAGVLFPYHWRGQHRHLLGAASLVAAVASVALVIVSLVGGQNDDPVPPPAPVAQEKPAGVAASVDFNGPNSFGCQFVAIDDADKQVQQPPKGDGNAVQAWRRSVGGVDGNETHLKITVRGTSDEAVQLTSMQVYVVARRDPSAKAAYAASDGCGEHLTEKTFGVSLDDPTTPVVANPGRDEAGNEIPAQPFPFSVSKSDLEVFLLDATTVTCDCDWEVVLHWEDEKGAEHTTVVRDGNEPFRTHAVPAGADTYLPNGQAGWLGPSTAPDQRILLATEGWTTANPVYRPESVELAGSGSFRLEDMSWSSWNDGGAVGTGSGQLRDLKGKLVRAPIRITLSNPEYVCDKNYFTKLEVRWTGKVPAGLKKEYEWIAGPPTCT